MANKKKTAAKGKKNTKNVVAPRLHGKSAYAERIRRKLGVDQDKGLVNYSPETETEGNDATEE